MTRIHGTTAHHAKDLSVRPVMTTSRRRYSVALAAVSMILLPTLLPCYTHAAPATKSENVAKQQSFAVYSRGCSRSMWQVTTHDNQRKAFLEASKHGERVHGNVFVMTGKRREKWSQHPRVGTDATLISCSVYRVFCKGSSLSGTTITASDASLLAEAITKGGGQVQIVYHFSAQ